MEKNIKFDKEKVWRAIEKDQSKKRRKKFLFFYFFGFLLLSVGAFYLFFDSTDDLLNEKPKQVITQNILKDPVKKEIVEILSSNENITILESNSKDIEKEKDSRIIQRKTKLSERVDHSEISSLIRSENKFVTDQQAITYSAIDKASTSIINKKIDRSVPKDNTVSSPSILDEISLSPLIYEQDNFELNWDYLDLPEKQKPLILTGKSIFIQSSLLFGETRISGDEIFSEVWNATQSLNFINSNSLGLELEFNNNLSLRSGLRLDIISMTYDHTQVDVEEGVVDNDTVSVYANRVITGNRNFTTLIDRRVVNHNNIYRVGLPLAIGYKIEGKKISLKLYGQSTLSYFQRFSGITSSQDLNHEFDQEYVNDTYFQNKWSLRLSGMILLEKQLSKSLKMNAGIELAFPESLLTSQEVFNLDYRGIGLSMGLSYGF